VTASSELVIQTPSFDRAWPRLEVATAAEARMNLRSASAKQPITRPRRSVRSDGLSTEISNSDSTRMHS
jgi:hypothetical protein